jgi:hypothetical protein
MLMNGTEGNQDEKTHVIDTDPREAERGQGGHSHKHVDSDVIIRWLSENGDFEALLGIDTDEGVTRLFSEFVKTLWREDSTSLEQGVKRVKEWLDEVLMPLL